MELGDWLKRALGSLALLAVVTGPAHADGGNTRDKRKAPVQTEQPTFKLDFSGAPLSTNSPAPPPGAATLRREDDGAMPFLGLKLSKPLGD